jgi:zinc/manganese transport system substrate-binding protein
MLRTEKAISGLTCALILLIFASACSNSTAQNGKINVVAAENFYGDLVSQIGGSHISVTSILSDPNVDPHEYQSSVQTATVVSHADLVIENGDNYDTWMDQLLSATPNDQRTVLVAATIARHPLPDNPHVWYGIDNIQDIAQSIADTLKKLDHADTTTFTNNLNTFKQSLTPLMQKMGSLKATYSGTPVGLTETIYRYQTQTIGLNVLTPLEFEKAIAEGNDPPTDTITTANNQVNHKQIKVLIYNLQTITPITTNLQDAARQQHIPIVGVTETMPTHKHYQTWMLDQLNALGQALAESA